MIDSSFSLTPKISQKDKCLLEGKVVSLPRYWPLFSAAKSVPCAVSIPSINAHGVLYYFLGQHYLQENAKLQGTAESPQDLILLQQLYLLAYGI